MSHRKIKALAAFSLTQSGTDGVGLNAHRSSPEAAYNHTSNSLCTQATETISKAFVNWQYEDIVSWICAVPEKQDG